DFDEIEGYSHIWFPEVESRWQQLTAAFRQPDPFDGFGANRLVERGLVGFLALAGLGLVLIRRGSVGGTLLAAGVTSGLVLLALTALDLRGNDRGIGCSPAPNPLDSPELISFASRFALSAAILCAAAWVWSSRAAGITLLRSLGAAGIALAMVAVAFVFDLLAFDEASLDLSTPMPALWPLWIIAGLAAGGVWVALRSELFVSHAVSLLIVVAGLVAIFTGIALEHDLAVDVHQTFVTIRRPRSALVFTHCEEPAISIALAVSRDEVLLSGWVFRPGDEELSIAVRPASRARIAIRPGLGADRHCSNGLHGPAVPARGRT
ncbi:MAG: hypothetical protein JNM17_27865, partial [Archangium sp.]|nr:hypothetical protein [Archangium sp.]